MSSAYILQVESAGFTDRLGVRSERKRGTKDDSKAFGQGNWKHGADIN